MGFPMLFFAENGDDANFCTEPSRGSLETARQFQEGRKGYIQTPVPPQRERKKAQIITSFGLLTLVLGKILVIGFFKRVNSREKKQLNRATGYDTQYGAERWVRLR